MQSSRALNGFFTRHKMTSAQWPRSSHMIAITRQRINDRDLLDREVRDDLDRVFVHDQHFFDAHAIVKFLPVLRLEGEGHSFFDLDRMVERPDARNHRRIVLRKTKSMPPKICRRL